VGLFSSIGGGRSYLKETPRVTKPPWKLEAWGMAHVSLETTAAVPDSTVTLPDETVTRAGPVILTNRCRLGQSLWAIAVKQGSQNAPLSRNLLRELACCSPLGTASGLHGPVGAERSLEPAWSPANGTGRQRLLWSQTRRRIWARTSLQRLAFISASERSSGTRCPWACRWNRRFVSTRPYCRRTE
jgi:hypothetical protein